MYFPSVDTDANVYADWSKFSLSIYQEVSTKLNLGAVSNSAKAVYFPKKTLLTIEMGFRDLILQMHRQIQKLLPIVWIKYNNWPLYTILKQPLWICVHTLDCIFSGVFFKKIEVRDFSSSQGLMLHGTVWFLQVYIGQYLLNFIEELYFVYILAGILRSLHQTPTNTLLLLKVQVVQREAICSLSKPR